MNSICILTPVYNDWESLEFLLEEISKLNLENIEDISVVIVNDGSTEKIVCDTCNTDRIKSFQVIELTRNIGHQRAIAIGLCYINENIEVDSVIVMDSDGEDKPEDIIKLIEAQKRNSDKIIFAKRKKRTEDFFFKIFYSTYKLFFYLLTGENIQFGNFSIIPGKLLRRLVSISEIWNHYSAGIIRSKIPFDSVPLDRGNRYSGISKMNFENLILHGLSSISIYIDKVGIRIMSISAGIVLLSFIGTLVVLFKKFVLFQSIEGWASTMIIGLIIIALQSLLISIFMTFLILSHRSQSNFIPIKDYKFFISSLKKIK